MDHPLLEGLPAEARHLALQVTLAFHLSDPLLVGTRGLDFKNTCSGHHQLTFHCSCAPKMEPISPALLRNRRNTSPAQQYLMQ
jgi:hypothetical protein